MLPWCKRASKAFFPAAPRHGKAARKADAGAEALRWIFRTGNWKKVAADGASDRRGAHVMAMRPFSASAAGPRLPAIDQPLAVTALHAHHEHFQRAHCPRAANSNLINFQPPASCFGVVFAADHHRKHRKGFGPNGDDLSKRINWLCSNLDWLFGIK